MNLYSSRLFLIATLFLLFFNSAFCLAAPIVPDGSTNTGIVSSNPYIVNIAAPNANGTSINNYTYFNVPASGAVLNNSSNMVFSQVIGGQIAGNPNLGGNSAKTIINQVTSNNPSFLEGKLEIAGPKANLIIANPNGIKINGGQFLNTGITSLVTGQAVVNSQAGNDEIHLITNSGQIEIGAGGLSGFMDNLNLISKTLKIQGQITNSNPRLSAGVQTITGNSHLITNSSNDSFPNVFTPYFTNMPSTGSGVNNPEFIVNLDQLGGITASKISILVTDKGAGVNFDQGSINAKADFEILADGKLQFKNHQANVRGDTYLEAAQIQANGLNIIGQQNIGLNAELINLQASNLSTDNDLNLFGDSVNTSGQSSLKAKGYFNIGANNIEFADTEVNIGRKSEIIANNFTFKNPFSTWQSEDIVFDLSNNFNNIGAAIDGRNSLDIQAINLNQSSGAYLLSSAGSINLDISDQINNSASFMRSFNDLNMESTNLNNTNSQIVSTNGSINLTIGQNLNNANSQIISTNGNTTSTIGENLNNTNSQIISTNGNITSTIGKNLNNANSQITSMNENINLIIGQNLNNQNSLIQSQKELKVEAGNKIR